jgi:hypothetical protein
MDTLTMTESVIDMQWVGTQVLRDTDDADAYHAVTEFDVTVSN